MKNFTWKTVMSYRNVAYGLASIWIVLYHLEGYRYVEIPVITKIFYMGNVPVDIFLFLSAIGLSYSIEKNGLKQFYKNRFNRILIVYFLTITPFEIWKWFISMDITAVTVPNFLFELSTLSYFFNEEGLFPVWYIPCILLFYMCFPFLYRIYRKNKWYIIILICFFVCTTVILIETDSVIIRNIERTFARIPIFLFGIFVSDYVKNDKRINNMWILGAFLVVIITMFIYPVTNALKVYRHMVYIKYIYGAIGISILIVEAFILEKIKKYKIVEFFLKIFAFLGALSLEIYLIHSALNRFLGYYNTFAYGHFLIHYIGVLGYSIFTAYFLSKVSKRTLSISNTFEIAK